MPVRKKTSSQAKLQTKAKNPSTHTSPLYRKIIATIRRVPKGKVASYGQIAEVAGAKGAARQVVWTLHTAHKYGLPWQRIINAQGKIAMKTDISYIRQRDRLLAEGVEFDEYGRVDMERFGWKPRGFVSKKQRKSR